MKTANPSTLALISANTLLFVLAIFLDWTIFDVIVIFWAENIVIGFFNIAKMSMAQTMKDPRSKNLKSLRTVRIVLTLFFCVHYFAFCAGHGVFIFDLLADADGPIGAGFDPVSFFIGVAVIAVSHGISFYTRFIGSKEYLTLGIDQLMIAPYSRIIIVHLTIILGAILITMIGITSVFIVLLFFAAKIWVDLWRHKIEHKLKTEFEKHSG